MMDITQFHTTFYNKLKPLFTDDLSVARYFLRDQSFAAEFLTDRIMTPLLKKIQDASKNLRINWDEAFAIITDESTGTPSTEDGIPRIGNTKDREITNGLANLYGTYLELTTGYEYVKFDVIEHKDGTITQTKKSIKEWRNYVERFSKVFYDMVKCAVPEEQQDCVLQDLLDSMNTNELKAEILGEIQNIRESNIKGLKNEATITEPPIRPVR